MNHNFLEILEIAHDNVIPPSESTDAEDNTESEDAVVACSRCLDLLHSALSVRRSIKSLTNEIPWPGDASSLEAESIIPMCLYNLLLWIYDVIKIEVMLIRRSSSQQKTTLSIVKLY